MTLENILTSGVISAVIAGIFAFVQKYRNTRLKNITNERKMWRDDIRKLSEELQKADDYNSILSVLVKLKVKINAFGNVIDYDNDYENIKLSILNPNDNCHDLDRQKLINLTKYYKNDAHIWKQIHLLESNDNKNIENKGQKTILIEYLSFLLKYDWERSKSEILINRQSIYSNIVFLLSSILVALSVFFNSQTKDKLFTIITVISLFSLCYIISSFPKYDFFDKIDYDKRKIDGVCFIPTLVIMLIIFLVNLGNLSSVVSSKSNDMILLVFSLLLLLYSIGLNCGTIIKRISLDEEYRDLLLSYELRNKNEE